MPNRVGDAQDEQIDEILAQVPHWFVRSGTVMIALTVGVFLLVGWFVKYPDVVRSRIAVTTREPPIRLVAPSAGRVSRVLVADGSVVEPGQYMAVLENPADYRALQVLRRYTAGLRAHLADPGRVAAPAALPAGLALGDLQTEYAELYAALSEYASAVGDTYDPARAGWLREQIRHHEQLDRVLREQRQGLVSQVELDRREQARREELVRRGLMSEAERDQAEAKGLQSGYAVQSADRAITENQIRILDYRNSLADLEQRSSQTSRRAELGTREALEKLEGRIAAWENAYVIRAPTRGRVSFLFYGVQNRFVAPPQEVMAVVPESGGVVGVMNVPPSDVGTVAPGQEVQIVFDGYPFAEWGSVSGKVSAVAPVSRDGLYTITVQVPPRLTTSYGRTIEFKPDMQGAGEVVTRDARLLTRVFHSIYGALSLSR